ncbi:MAG: M3 family peptidase, partial [bacterium]
MEVDNEADLAGLPFDCVEAAKARAIEQNKPDKWIFTLEMPSYIPFVRYAKNRYLREKMVRALGSRANGGEFDNRSLVKEITKLRYERAQLLGYSTHAD